jgi:S1-C subfamily serine protease
MRHTYGILIAVLCLFPSTTCNARELRDLYRATAQAIVLIKTMQTDMVQTSRTEDQPQFTTSGGLGSGALISADGRVLTAAHVVQTADTVAAVFQDGTQVPARVITSAPFADVAIIQLETVPKNIAPLAMGNSDEMEPGDEVFVIGAPYGLSHTLTAGHISARHKPRALLGNLQSVELLQTDAAVNVGNSGAPLLNMKGEIVGVVSHIVSQSGGSQGLGFAVTASVVRQVLLDQKALWTGIDFFPLAGNLARAFNLPQSGGLLVQRVAADSPADKMGLKGGTMQVTIDDQEFLAGGDVILEVLGIAVAGDEGDGQRIMPLMRKLKSGDTLKITILRDGKLKKISYTLPK